MRKLGFILAALLFLAATPASAQICLGYSSAGKFQTCTNGASIGSLSGSNISAGIVGTGYGGTGLTTFGGAGAILYSTSSSALAALAAGTSGYILKSNGAAAPSWLSTLPVANGGTGQTAALVAGGLLYGASTTAQGVTSAGTSGYFATSGGTGAPTWSAPPLGIVQTGFFGSTTTSTTYYFTGLSVAPITSGERVFYQAPRAVTVKNCSCYVGFAGANPAAVTCTGRLWNGTVWADTATTCTIKAPAYRCVDTTHSHTMAAQDLLAANVVTNGSVTLNASTEAAWSCEVYAQ